MSIFIDELAKLIEQSVEDADATREDWLRAVDQAFPTTKLDPFEPIAGEPPITWQINGGEDLSPAESARDVWQQIFCRGVQQPTADEACVFVVSTEDGSVEIDLSEERFAHLFTT